MIVPMYLVQIGLAVRKTIRHALFDGYLLRWLGGKVSQLTDSLSFHEQHHTHNPRAAKCAQVIHEKKNSVKLPHPINCTT